MKIFAACSLLAVFVGLTSAFSVLPGTVTPKTADTALRMGLLDNLFQPKKKTDPPVATQKKKSNNKWIEHFFGAAMHGHGSEEGHLDELYEAQQQLLHDRQQTYGSDGHKMMRDKYHHDLKDIPTIDHDPAVLNEKEDDAMYFDETGPAFSFPWQKKLKP